MEFTEIIGLIMTCTATGMAVGSHNRPGVVPGLIAGVLGTIGLMVFL